MEKKSVHVAVLYISAPPVAVYMGLSLSLSLFLGVWLTGWRNFALAPISFLSLEEVPRTKVPIGGIQNGRHEYRPLS